MQKKITTSAPGRICLFGEHQDYLQLPVITAAINLRVEIKGQTQDARVIELDLPDINEQESFSLPDDGSEVAYQKKRDYFRSSFNVLLREGVRFDRGVNGVVRGRIPINSGTSSSSALTVAWVRFLTALSRIKKPEFTDPEYIARMAHRAEVEEFGEPGGMMDHFATAIGGVLYQDFRLERMEQLHAPLGKFVLGDSLEPKDTMGILTRVKTGVLKAVEMIKKKEPQFDLYSFPEAELAPYQRLMTQDQMKLLRGALLNRDLTLEARRLFTAARFDPVVFGKLLNEHQKILADLLGISTPKIDLMLNQAMQAGAYGGKINGSGGGGCMFVYAPENPDKVAQALEDAGGRPYVIEVSQGVECMIE